MKKILIPIFIVLCLFAYIIGFTTTTTTDNLSLVIPAAEDTTVDWFDTVNANFELVDDIFDTVTLTEFGYLDGVTSAIQTQLDAKIEATLTEEQVEDYVGAMTTGNTETFITVTYQDATADIDFVVPVKDEDNMASDSTTYLCTQQSIKAYADTLHALQYLKTELDDFSELQGIISDKTLVNEEDICTIDANWVNTANPWADDEVANNITIDLATLATTITVTDNEATNENNPLCFVAGADPDGGSLGIETDGDLHYNPSTGLLTATGFAGALTGNVTGDASGSSGSCTGNAATCTTASAGDAAVDFFGAGVDAVTDATTCTDLEGTLLSIGGGTLNAAIPADHVTYDMMQDTSDTNKILGRSTAGAGTVEEIACTAAGRAILDDADASTQRTTLGLVIGTNVLAEQTIGIADNNLLEVDHASMADNDFAKVTVNGLEGRSYSETRSDLSIEIAYADSFATGGAGTSGDPWTGDCIQAAIDSITTGIVYLNAGYYQPTTDASIDLKTGITLMGIPGKSIIDCDHFSADTKVIEVHGSVENSIAATVNIAEGDKTITMGDTSSLTVDDYIRIASDEVWEAGHPVGEVQRIKTITSGTVITLYQPILDDYTTANNARLYEMNLVEDIIVDGVILERGGGDSTYGIYFQLGKHCVIRNCQITGATNVALLWDEMLYGLIENNYIKDSYYSGTSTSYGIGLMNASQYNIIRNNRIEIARHCVSVHSSATPGYARFNIFESNIMIGGSESTQAIADSHIVSEHIEYKNNIFIGDGLRTGMNVMGDYQQVIGNVFINCHKAMLIWSDKPLYSVLSENHFRGGTYAFYFDTGAADYDYYIRIADNVIHGTTYGIGFDRYSGSATTCGEIYIINNVFNVATNWIRDVTDDITLDNCLIYGNETFGKTSTLHALTNSKAFKAKVAELGGVTNYIKVAAGGVLTLEGTANIAGVDATEMDILDGLTSTTAELNYVEGVTSAIQTQLDTKAALGANSDITSLTGLTTPLGSAYGGTGVANAAGETITLSGGNAITFTTTAATNVTLPTTGTLSTLGYTINILATNSTPIDGQTRYIGNVGSYPHATAGTRKVYIRKAGTIKIAEIYCYAQSTVGTNENWSLYVRLNNTSDTLIATVGAATAERVFSNTSLSIAVSAGDYIEIKGVQPTWATNPVGIVYGGYIYIE